MSDDYRHRHDEELADRLDHIADRNQLLGLELPDQPAARAAQQEQDAALLTQRAIAHYRLIP